LGNEIMKYKNISLLAVPLFLIGCNAGSMEVTRYDGVTGTSNRTLYSKYYDAGSWASKNSIGISVVVDHEKKVVPVFQGMKQSMGLLGPDDTIAAGKVSLYIWNRTNSTGSIKLHKMKVNGYELKSKNKLIPLSPMTRTGGEVDTVRISNYGTKIPVEIYFRVEGEDRVMKLTLERRTYKDLDKYFGTNGTPPYPWFH